MRLIQIRAFCISPAVIWTAILPAVTEAVPTEENSNRPLWAAIHDGDSGTVKALLDGGVDVNAKDDAGSTALMHAVANADIGGSETSVEQGRGRQCSEQERGNGLALGTA